MSKLEHNTFVYQTMSFKPGSIGKTVNYFKLAKIGSIYLFQVCWLLLPVINKVVPIS
jgi:hypothetical protein